MNTVIDKHGMGIYIHIPFCVRKCVYCDFLSAPADDEVKKTYMKALADEIEYVAKCNRNKISKRIVKSIFFGGGTPTVVDAKDIECILNTVRKNFPVDSKAEITIECNPGTLNKEKADIYVQAGVNRISFGLQSPEDSLLKLLGRIHTFEQFDESVKIARAAGIRNINVDIMAALPGQSLESYVEGIKKVLRYEPEHISAYSLIIEEGTYLCDNLEEFPRLPDEDTERNMYYETAHLLKEYGYERYEISNYAKPGYECRHNLSYWDRTEYLGFGIGAASLFDKKRTSNTSDLQEYIELAGKRDVYSEKVTLSQQDAMEEFMFLGLRKVAGVSFEKFEQEFGLDIHSVYGEIISKNVSLELMEYVGDKGVRLTERGIDISNVVLSDFLLT